MSTSIAAILSPEPPWRTTSTTATAHRITIGTTMADAKMTCRNVEVANEVTVSSLGGRCQRRDGVQQVPWLATGHKRGQRRLTGGEPVADRLDHGRPYAAGVLGQRALREPSTLAGCEAELQQCDDRPVPDAGGQVERRQLAGLGIACDEQRVEQPRLARRLHALDGACDAALEARTRREAGERQLRSRHRS